MKGSNFNRFIKICILHRRERGSWRSLPTTRECMQDMIRESNLKFIKCNCKVTHFHLNCGKVVTSSSMIRRPLTGMCVHNAVIILHHLFPSGSTLLIYYCNRGMLLSYLPFYFLISWRLNNIIFRSRYNPYINCHRFSVE